MGLQKFEVNAVQAVLDVAHSGPFPARSMYESPSLAGSESMTLAGLRNRARYA
jgi:hypothetical protein